jgi:regulator of replication initiation timing
MLKAKEIAEELEIKDNTARKWTRDFSIPYYSTASAKINYTEEAANLMREIKNLKDLGYGYDTITRKIGPKRDALLSQAGPTDHERDTHEPHGSRANPDQDDVIYINPVPDVVGEMLGRFSSDLADILQQSFQGALAENNQIITTQINQILSLSREMAGVAQENGKLQAEVSALRNMLERAEKAVNSLPSVIDHERAVTQARLEEQEKIRAQALADKKEAEIESLKRELLSEKRLSWWDKLLGKKPEPP